MAGRLVFAREVEEVLSEAYACYEARQVGLGEDFLQRVGAALERVLRFPEMYQVVYDHTVACSFAASPMRSSTNTPTSR